MIALGLDTTSALASSAIGFIIGFITGTIARSSWIEIRVAQGSHRILAAILIFLALATVGQGIWFQHRQTQCNREVLQILSDRSALADADRTNLAELIEQVITSTERGQSRAALRLYLDRKAEIDATRADQPLPDPEQICR